MSNQPLREDLLSGYLDNQLSLESRAEVEIELARNADLSAQFEIMKQQSLQCASIPKYKLDAGFADRVLSDPRTDEAFSAMAGRHGIARGDAIYRSGIHPLRSAAIAILSLAALVLITLFLQNPEGGREAPVLSKGADIKSTTGLKTDENAIAGKLGSDNSAGLERQNIDTISSKSDRDFNEQVLESDFLEKKGGGANQILAAEIEGMQKESAADDVLDGLHQQPMPSQMVEAHSAEREYNFQQIDESKSKSESFAKRGVVLVKPNSADEMPTDQVAGAVLEAMGPSASPSLGQIAASQTLGTNLADSLNGFIEIRYTGGPEKLVDFATALSRNQIVINAPAQVADKQLDRSVATSEKSGDLGDQSGIGDIRGDFGGGVMGGAGRGGLRGTSDENESQSGEMTQQRLAGSSILGDAIAPASDSQLFLITATPQQMVGLIDDLRSTAAISGYQMPEWKPQLLPIQPPGPTSSFDVGRSMADQETASNSDLRLPPGQPLTAGEGLERSKDQLQLDQLQFADRKHSESVPAADKQLVFQPGLDGSLLGIAQSVERQMELRANEQKESIPSTSRELMKSARDNDLESSQQEDEQTDVDALYLYFATQAGEVQARNSPVRQYLLFVHSQNAAVEADRQTESVIAKPVPADASDLKK